MVVFTGVGMSTESGIPDFRSPWGTENMQPIMLQDFLPAKKCELRRGGARSVVDAEIGGAQPNKGQMRRLRNLWRRAKLRM